MTEPYYIEKLEESLWQAIEQKDRKSVHEFVLSMSVRQGRSAEDILMSIEKLNQRMDLTLEKMDNNQREMHFRFESMQKQMDERFNANDQRFESVQKQMDERFHTVDKRFDDMNRGFTAQTWLISFVFLSLSIMMTAYKFLF